MLVRSDTPGNTPQRKGATVSTIFASAALFSVPRQHLGKPGQGTQCTPGIGERKTAERLDQRRAYRPGIQGITRPERVQRPSI
jgi:hypothetical protein